MDKDDRSLILEGIEIQTNKIVDALELNTEKLQELLERVECIDNSLDDIKEEDCQNAMLETLNEVVRRLELIIQQGRP